MMPWLLLAQLPTIPEPSVYTVLMAYGPMGIMLVYFLFRFEKHPEAIRTLSHRIDGMTRALLLDVASRDSTGPHAKRIAQELLAKIEARTSDKD